LGNVASSSVLKIVDEKINILMVDDQPGKLLTYEAMLGELGENLIKVHSGMEALEHLLKNDIALVLMDVSMPGMDGFETAQMIHGHPRFQNTPIVFISGIHMTDLDRLKGYQHGAVDYLSVPVVPELLRAKVRVFAELHRKTQQLEALNARMTTVQDEERRRIARELHDSVGQLLAAVSMNSALVEAESHKLSPEAAKRVHENAAMVEEATKEIRTISHLLHPPLLDEAGLASALHCYVEGFSERSKIVAKLDIPQSFEGLSKEMELCIFRVVQECLTNIHRHAGSPTAAIRITQDGAYLRVEIEDAGKGIPPEKQSLFRLSARTGVGLRGMRERLRQLGGTLQIQSNGHGTQVIATLPVARTPVVAPPELVGSGPSEALGGTVACLSRTEPSSPQPRSWLRKQKSGVQISTPP
jgi:signal transduction histidine kinase